MLGWTKWAVAIAVAGLAAGEAAPSLAAGDTTVAMQRLGPPEVEARREALLKQMLNSGVTVARRLAVRDGVAIDGGR